MMRFSKILLTFMMLLVTQSALAQGNKPSIIRDTEIENIIKEWTAPVVHAANLDTGGVNVVIVQSNQLNAFVAGGANIFLYTGLIERTKTPEELIGVFAHELGHIAGGHLIQGRAAMERASYESILGTIIGIGAAIATGSGEAAAAIISGSNNIATRQYLAHSRIHESSADQAALRYLKQAHINPDGLASFLEELESEELLPSHQQSEYIRTHPLTSNRIEAVRSGGADSAYKGQASSQQSVQQHARMKAKLLGFIAPGRVPWIYDDSDKSVPARYARAIAAYRNNDIDTAIRDINNLIAMEPNNPYFQELKGQMLVDFGRVQEALPYYRRASTSLPNSPLIEIALAHALIESRGGKAHIQEALDHLEKALIREPRSTRAYRLLGIAYGKMGQEGKAKLYLAEEAVLQRRFDYAKQLAETALRDLPPQSRDALKAKDILLFLENNKE